MLWTGRWYLVGWLIFGRWWKLTNRSKIAPPSLAPTYSIGIQVWRWWEFQPGCDIVAPSKVALTSHFHSTFCLPTLLASFLDTVEQITEDSTKGSKATLVYGQMNEPPGARARVALTGLTIAEVRH